MDWAAAIAAHKALLARYTWTDAALALAERYRSELTRAGFSEAAWPAEGKNLSAKNPLRFYRQDTELTAFFVNLEPAGDSIRIFYGFASTAFTRVRSNENVLTEMGIDESGNTLRFLLSSEAPDAPEQIASVFSQYQGTGKDALLGIIKERRKAWLARITAVLKPLGFKKKGNEWSKVLPSGHTLYFGAEKSSYSDSYNFDIRLRQAPGEVRAGDWCAFAVWEQEQDRAIDPFCHHCFDWQLDAPEELDGLLDRFVREYVRPLDTLDPEGLFRILRCSKKACPVHDCPLRQEPQ